MSLLAEYLSDLRNIRSLAAGVPETSFYPPLATLFNTLGKKLKPKVYCLIHLQNTGAGIPEAGFFTASQFQRDRATVIPGQKPSRGVMEVKPFAKKMDELQASEQVLRYLQHYNQVLITNLREFRLLIFENGAPRKVDGYTLAPTPEALFEASTLKQHAELFPDFLERVLRRQASITDPSDLAWFLASYAREARWRAEHHPLSSFETIKKALEESLGLRFEQEKGDHFFRSTLVQTLFYGIFSAWVLWSRLPEAQSSQAHFDWRTAAFYLRVPVLRKLFAEVSDPGPLNASQITEMLDLAGDTLARVDRTAFFSKFSQSDAVQYFYEPFLQAFDPQLRKDLGVWYTPREIVSYMVERVDHLLRTELNQPLGLASPDVCVLDPCCGTGAYLTAVLDRIHRTLLAEAGDDNALVPSKVREAALNRIFGFEILPAPFVIAHMQLAAELATLKAPLSDTQRAGVFLTNALTGWVPEQEPKTSIFPDLQKEKEDAEAIKRSPSILVILGNPPYNGYSGIAVGEERDLTHAYRAPVHGLTAPQGQGLNDLYIRFFRIAERRIMQNASGQGIVCFISNYSWLDGLSHTTMRHHFLRSFSDIYIDNLHGDRKISEYAPDGRTSETVFAVSGSSVGIRIGTAVSTLVRRTASKNFCQLHYRDFTEARAGDRREHMMRTLTEHGDPYETLAANSSLGLPFKPRAVGAGYGQWPRLTELFPAAHPGIKTSRDALLVDIDRAKLTERISAYLNDAETDESIAMRFPSAMEAGARFDPRRTRSELLERGFRDWQLLRFAYRPFDLRWIYWEPTTKLLDEKREGYVSSVPSPTLTLVAQQKTRAFASPGQAISALGCLDLMDRGATCFPLTVLAQANFNWLDGADDHSTGYYEFLAPNLSIPAERYLAGLGHPTSPFLVPRPSPASGKPLFIHALSVMHSPQFRVENGGALLADWPRIPLPATNELLAHSAALGSRLADLLDPESSIHLNKEWSFLARLVLPQPSDLTRNLQLTAGWGFRGQGSTVMPGRGKLNTRPWSQPELERLTTLAAAQTPAPLTLEQTLSILGDTCVDVFLNRRHALVLYPFQCLDLYPRRLPGPQKVAFLPRVQTPRPPPAPRRVRLLRPGRPPHHRHPPPRPRPRRLLPGHPPHSHRPPTPAIASPTKLLPPPQSHIHPPRYNNPCSSPSPFSSSSKPNSHPRTSQTNCIPDLQIRGVNCPLQSSQRVAVI